MLQFPDDAVPFVPGPPMGVAEQKKKLLWGNKAQETQETAQVSRLSSKPLPQSLYVDS